MNSAEAAAIVDGEISSWLGMDEKKTRADVAHEIARRVLPHEDVESLRLLARDAYREVMFRQAMHWTRVERQIEAYGWRDFIKRSAEAL